MSSDQSTEGGAASWPSKETNCVNPSAAGKQDLTDEELILERVNEFREAYDELADLPLSRTHGRKLRRIVTESDWTEEFVEPAGEFEDTFSVSSLDSREAGTWSEALHAFLRAHVEYKGMLARFGDGSGDTFDIPLVDAWGESYSRKQYARARAVQRQMSGGERPSGGEAIADWDDPATAMLTTTASSRPGSERVAPVDHLDSVHDSFSYDGVRYSLRNTMEYHLGLEPEQWGYWAQAEPHGMGAAESDETPGVNACYTHIHIGVYFDSAATPGLREVGSELERVIDKHVEVCETAGFDAHDYTQIDDYLDDDDGCISLNGDVDNLGSYLAAYMGGYTEELLEKPIEYLAWGAVYWSAARRRTSRSKIVNESIRADRCEQRAESEQSHQTASHGERVAWNDGRGLDVVCSSCGSGWSIDQSRLSEPVTDDDLDAALDDEYTGDYSPDEEPCLRDQWPSATSAFSVGESLRHKAIRERVITFIEIHGSSVSLPRILGQLNIDPKHRDFVQTILDGDHEVPRDSFAASELDGAEWELIAIVDSDGEEHSPGGGGVDMVSLHLPHRQLLEQTRLRHDLASGEVFRCEKCRLATHDPRIMAHHFLEHGFDEPGVVESMLRVEDYYNNERDCMQKPSSNMTEYSERYGTASPKPSHRNSKESDEENAKTWLCSDCDCFNKIGHDCARCGREEPRSAQRV